MTTYDTCSGAACHGAPIWVIIGSIIGILFLSFCFVYIIVDIVRMVKGKK